MHNKTNLATSLGIVLSVLMKIGILLATGDLAAESLEENESWNFHGQLTYVTQQKNNFASGYYGRNSLLNRDEGGGGNSYTLASTGYLGFKLWQGAQGYLNPEVFQGIPFHRQLAGLGGFQNSELQKGAYTQPVAYMARAFLRQTFNLGGEDIHLTSQPNQLADRVSTNRVVVSYGKLATLDFFDQNRYSHDGRSQFQNFALLSLGAYSYAADTKGFTYGAVLEWYQDEWITKAGRLALPVVPNTETLDFRLRSNYVDQMELSHLHELLGQPGAVRVLWYQQIAYMGNYQQALIQNAAASPPSGVPEVVATRQAGQKSRGYGINAEQAVDDNFGVFARWSWNQGQTETQTIDISRSFSGGLSLKGVSWSRPDDHIGIGCAVNGLAGAQIEYLRQGGISPLIGDGKLNYQRERIFEAYYSAAVSRTSQLSFDIQRVANPAYNSARGPVNIFGFRFHADI